MDEKLSDEKELTAAPESADNAKTATDSAKSGREKAKEAVKTYFKTLPKRYFITAFSGMAQGLFVTLIAGTILAQIGGWLGDNAFAKMVLTLANIAKSLMGVGIGVGIAHALNKNKLIVFSAAVAGFVGAFALEIIQGNLSFLFELNGSSASYIKFGAPGNPIGSYVVTMFTIEIASLYAGKTKLDIILIPLGMMVLAMGAIYVAYPFIWVINQLGVLIAIATNATPFVMGIVISVIMGILLTMPTSSAAIWVAVASPVLTGGTATAEQVNAMLLAGGAAAVGCACHMVGFAVSSFRENGVGGLISQGIGTSMLQIPNIMKKPIIMVPQIISSAICGPLSTCVFFLYCDATGGGMGTSGLVGVFSTISSSMGQGLNGVLLGFGIALLFFILPAAIGLGVTELFRKKGWIKYGDMKLDS